MVASGFKIVQSGRTPRQYRGRQRFKSSLKSGRSFQEFQVRPTFLGSSKGRTTDSESVYRGSNPWLRTKFKWKIARVVYWRCLLNRWFRKGRTGSNPVSSATYRRLPEWSIGARWKRDGSERGTRVQIPYLLPVWGTLQQTKKLYL